MSTASLERFVRDHPLVIPERESDRCAVLLSDSQGDHIKRIDNTSGVPLRYQCSLGQRTVTAVDKFIENFPALKAEIGKPIIVYVYLGTCDITKKIRRRGPIDLRYREEGKACLKVKEQFERLQNFVLSSGEKIKFICIPPYSVVKYNRRQRHRNPEIFESADLFVKREVAKINTEIQERNQTLKRNTIRLDLDIIKVRSRARQSINYHLLEDGIHPCNTLCNKWLRRLQLDVIKECWSDPDILDLEVDPQDLLAL